MPRSHRITCSLPAAKRYSAASSRSSTFAASPRFSSTGLRIFPSALSNEKFCMLRAPAWVVRVDPARDELVGREGRLDRFDHRVAVEVALGEDALIAQRAEHDPLTPRHIRRLEALRLDLGEDFLGHFLGGFALQNDGH